MTYKTIKELLKDSSWVVKDDEYDNFAQYLLNTVLKRQKTFEEIKEKIDCAYIKLCAREDYNVVLKQNYTEQDLVNFFLSLNIAEKITSSYSLIWSKDGRCYWSYHEVSTGDSVCFDWVYQGIPKIHKKCLYNGDEIK